MKAIDYFNKYDLTILEDGKLFELFQDLNKEASVIAKQRNSSSNSTMISIIKELNTKWNSLCAIYRKKYGSDVLIRNGYIKYWEKRIPQLKSN